MEGKKYKDFKVIKYQSGTILIKNESNDLNISLFAILVLVISIWTANLSYDISIWGVVLGIGFATFLLGLYYTWVYGDSILIDVNNQLFKQKKKQCQFSAVQHLHLEPHGQFYALFLQVKGRGVIRIAKSREMSDLLEVGSNIAKLCSVKFLENLDQIEQQEAIYLEESHTQKFVEKFQCKSQSELRAITENSGMAVYARRAAEIVLKEMETPKE